MRVGHVNDFPINYQTSKNLAPGGTEPMIGRVVEKAWPTFNPFLENIVTKAPHRIDQLEVINRNLSLSDIDHCDAFALWNTHFIPANIMRLVLKKPCVKYVGDPGADSMTIYAIKHSRLVLFNSPLLLETYMNHNKEKGWNLDTTKWDLLYPFCDLYPYQREWPNRKKDTWMFLSLISEHKGIHDYIRHAVEHPEWPHDVYGQFIDESMEERVKKACKIYSNLTYCGAVSDAEKPAIYGAHEWFWFKPKWIEAFGIVYLEALYSGCKLDSLPTVGLLSWRWDLDRDEDEIKAKLHDMPLAFWEKAAPHLGLQ